VRLGREWRSPPLRHTMRHPLVSDGGRAQPWGEMSISCGYLLRVGICSVWAGEKGFFLFHVLHTLLAFFFACDDGGGR